MDNLESKHHPAADIDADVVCAMCGLENEHGTLMCRQCGNNLRDQKQNRLVELAAGMATEQAASRRRILSGLLSVFGIVLIVGVALNLEAIATMLSGAEASTRAAGVAYWRGPDASTFEEMVAQLSTNPPTESQRAAAISAPLATTTLEGRYVISDPSALRNAELGVASIRQSDDTLFFVAVLDNGGEIRGSAKVEANGAIKCESGVVEYRGNRYEGVGYATRNAQGGFSIYGAPFDEGSQFEIFAFPIAE